MNFKSVTKQSLGMKISIKLVRFCLTQACIALVRRVELQTRFSRCETLLKSHENSVRSSEHETRLVASPEREHDQDMN